MARHVSIVVTIALLAALFLAAQVGAQVNDDEINPAIEKGVAWLAAQQNSDGSWSLDGPQMKVLQTSLAVLKLTDYAREQKKDPFSESYQYRDNLVNGLGFILGKVRTEAPDLGAIWDFSPCEQPCSPYTLGHDPAAPPIIIETSAAIMALSNTEIPDTMSPQGTYRQVVQAAVNYLEAAQMVDTGGWASFDQDPWLYPDGQMCEQMSQYYSYDICLYNQFQPDQLNSGFVALAFQYANKAFDIEITDTVELGLGEWITGIQDTETEIDPDLGGAYLLLPLPANPPDKKVLYTGLLLLQQRYRGIGPGNAGVQGAVQYISEHWVDEDEYDWNLNWKEDLATICIATKGLAAQRIQAVPGAGESGDWFGVIASIVMAGQGPDGSWPLGSSWALLTLEGKPPEPVMILSKATSRTMVEPGETVIYTFNLENTGKSPIYDVSLSDNKLGDVTGLVSGDANGNLILDPGEKWVYEAVSPPLTKEVRNIGTASGTDLWGWEVTATSSEVIVSVNVVANDPVLIDIKPGSCPNAFNRGDKGVMSVAVVGTSEFDVTKIDPESITLNGVSALRSGYDDVATPYVDTDPANDPMDCTTDEADGFVDLVLKFHHQDIAATLSADIPPKGDAYPLILTGTLKEEFGATPITGTDHIWVVE